VALFSMGGIRTKTGAPHSKRERDWRPQGAGVSTFRASGSGSRPAPSRNQMDWTGTGEPRRTRIGTRSKGSDRSSDSGFAGLNGNHNPAPRTGGSS
jgi:hypothetical protein